MKQKDNKKEDYIRPTFEHVYLYSKLKKKFLKTVYLRPQMIISELKRMIRVPSTFHYPILKQMEEEGLIKRINHQRYEIEPKEKTKKIKEINEKIKAMMDVNRRNRFLKIMEEYGLIKEDKATKFKVLTSDCDKKIKSMGNYTFW